MEMDVPFESFANLVYRLGHPPKSKSSQKPIPPTKIFTSWLNHLPRPLPSGTGKRLFRLLFPHEGSRRRYGLKEYKLANELEKVLGFKGLSKWDAVGWGDVGMGCLGKAVERTARERASLRSESPKSTITMTQIDRLLDQLAAHSPFSQLSQVPSSSLTQAQILTILYRDSDLSPYALCLLTQIILRDLRPLVNPLPSLRIRNPTAMLRMKSNTGPAQLDLIPAMRCWDGRMAGMYLGGQGNLDWCADQVGKMGTDGEHGPAAENGPVVGVNVQIPKCRKGRSIEDALKEFSGGAGTPGPRAIWAETKYDGYRMQIHVDRNDYGQSRIRIFSKSKRDSTADRLNAHAIILSTLGIPIPRDLPAHPALVRKISEMALPSIIPTPRSVILEAEVVPYNEGQREGGRGPGVEEFWWLGAAGVTVNERLPPSAKDHNRHLCLYFFDILYLDGQNLLNKSLEERRSILKRVVRVIPNFSHLAEYSIIPMTSHRSATDALQNAFDRSGAKRNEGLVLKAPESTYLDPRWRWVKLKKDYIPNLGDCVDLVLLGAGWDMDRARDLRVDTSVFTTFYIGVLTNHTRVKAKIETPHFEILFRVSYGPDRDVLEVINQNIRHGRWKSKSYDKDDPFKRRLLGLSWTYYIPKEMTPPSVLFEQPLCAEVMGAGFQRLVGSNLYELRWSRLQKIYESRERSWTEALTASELITTAHQSLGYLTSPDTTRNPTSPRGSPQDDSIRALWRSSSAAALTDIPDSPTPSPERPSPRRIQSAPDILFGFKSSPPSPINAAPTVSRRLFEEIEGVEIETGLEGVRPSHTPSPTRKRFGSPLRPLMSKRQRGGGREEIEEREKQMTTPFLPSTPLFTHRTENSITFVSDSLPRSTSIHLKVQSKKIGWKGGKRRVKPLSLRSRLRMVVSGRNEVSVRI